LRADPAGIAPTAVEECSRVEPRVRHGSSWNQKTTTLLDFDIPADSMTYLDLVAAHYDADAFPDPYRVDVTRHHARPQLNFGIGRHFCLGAALARMELQVVFTAIGSAWSMVEASGEVELEARALDRGVKSLPITITR
jgi:cytochrome P450